MKLLIDTTPAIPGKSGAVGAFRNMIQLLPGLSGNVELFVFASDEQKEYYEKFIDKSSRKQITFIKSSRKSISTLRRIVVQNIMLPWLCKKYQIDILFSFNPEPIFHYKMTKEVFKIVDLQFYDLASEFGIKKRIYRSKLGKRKVNRSSLIIANSKYTKDRIISIYPGTEAKIAVIHESYDNSLFTIPADLEAIKIKLKTAYGIDGSYILFVSSFRPYKNHIAAINAYKILKDNTKVSHSMIFIGNDINHYRALVEKHIERLGLQENIKIFDFVHHWELPFFYQGADLSIYPSECETFGIPPLESMACGTPVIAANVTSIPEICGDAAHLLNPNDIKVFANAMEKVLTDKSYSKTMRENGLIWCSKFTWARNIDETYKVLTQLL